MSTAMTILLVAGNLGLIYLVLAAPLGVRTVRLRRLVRAGRQHLWSAIHPLGANAGWSGEYVAARPAGGDQALVRLSLSWEGRDGLPIERIARLDDVIDGRQFSMRIIEDSSLDRSFWASYREAAALEGDDGAVVVTLSRTDRYRGAAILVFRYFALRREIAKLKVWAETGGYRKGGAFEHPVTQIGLAILSAFILWPLFGLNAGGLIMASVLTAVVALHELGHLAAFRLMGHRKVRMIFIPLLGGIAIGGRPYDSRFEVAFVALMGAGFSAFLVPIAIGISTSAHEGGQMAPAALLAALAGCTALFNIANLVPVWKFDGGQVLRQICGGPALTAAASFFLLAAFLGLGFMAGLPAEMLLAAGSVFAILGLMTSGSGVKPRHELKPIGGLDRLAIGGALLAVFAIHGYGVLWACARLA